MQSVYEVERVALAPHYGLSIANEQAMVLSFLMDRKHLYTNVGDDAFQSNSVIQVDLD